MNEGQKSLWLWKKIRPSNHSRLERGLLISNVIVIRVKCNSSPHLSICVLDHTYVK